MGHFPSIFLFSCCALYFGFVKSFTFTLEGQPTQCDPLSVSWTGGQAPFRLIIIAPGRSNTNISIPDANFQNNKGLFTLSSLPVSNNTQIYFAMSDATGAISGGTSNLMAVGNPLSGKSCNTSVPANDFFFSAESTLSQCGNFPFTNYQGAVKPLTIFAFIPGGQDSFVLPFSPLDTDNFNWKANISAQTQVTFSVIDSQGRNGGTDALRLVAPSGDRSCLLKTDGTSTSQTQPSGTSIGDPNKKTNSGGLSSGAIVGISVGGGVIVIMFVAVLLCWSRRRPNSKKFERRSIDLAEDFPPSPEIPQPMVGHQYTPVPYPPISASQSANGSASGEQPQRPPPLRLHSQHYDESSSSSAGSSASGGRQTKLVVHRDIDEELEELPPQYDDRRAPIPGLHPAAPSYGGQSEKRR